MNGPDVRGHRDLPFGSYLEKLTKLHGGLLAAEGVGLAPVQETVILGWLLYGLKHPRKEALLVPAEPYPRFFVSH